MNGYRLLARCRGRHQKQAPGSPRPRLLGQAARVSLDVHHPARLGPQAGRLPRQFGLLLRALLGVEVARAAAFWIRRLRTLLGWGLGLGGSPGLLLEGWPLHGQPEGALRPVARQLAADSFDEPARLGSAGPTCCTCSRPASSCSGLFEVRVNDAPLMLLSSAASLAPTVPRCAAWSLMAFISFALFSSEPTSASEEEIGS